MKQAKNISTLYYLQNRERLLAYQKKYYQENIEACRNRSKMAYLLGNVDFEKSREYARKYREKNREKLRIYQREYQRKRRTNMRKARSVSKFAHTPKSQKGLGDFHGNGIKAKLGKMRDDSMGMVALTPKKLKTPPRLVV